MSNGNNCIEKQVKEFCVEISVDPLLVQGAGGNVSWKSGDVLWVKASGKWLSEAEHEEIFVPVNLTLLQSALTGHDFSVIPEVTSTSDLRPSIETLLHALMPHRVVAHLHAIEILSHLVQVDSKEKIKNLVGSEVNWIYIDYFKPGNELARAVSEQLTIKPDADVVFLSNHGVVIGGEDVEEVAATLDILISRLKTPVPNMIDVSSNLTIESEMFERGYIPCCDSEINQLAIKDELYSRLYSEWALYPDHVVFLRAEAVILEKNFDLGTLGKITVSNPPFIFSIGNCVFESQQITRAQKSQLICYYHVICRQEAFKKLTTLSQLQVCEILNWDAESYRVKIQK